jgi:periplasmic protein TonB
MSPLQTPKNSPLRRGVVLVAGIIAALGLFVAIPFIQAVSTGFKDPAKINEVSFVLPPPPVVEIDTPPPPKQEDDDQEIEMDKEPPRLNLDQLELALNPGTGDLGGGINFDLSLDSRSLGTDDLIFDIDDVDERPRPVRMIQPVYPSALQRRKVEGRVYLIFVIDPQGNVVAPRVESSSHSEFEQPALDAIRRWKFSPGKRGGEAVRVRVRLPLQFVPN